MRSKSNKLLENNIEVNGLFSDIKELVINSRSKVYRAVNQEMLNLHWNIGKIISNIQGGTKRAAYGEQVLNELSRRLTAEFGRGFSPKNLRKMRRFYQLFQIWPTVSAKLSWSYYVEIIRID